MCGIAGFIDLTKQKRDGAQIVQRINTAQRHRGPDGEGIYSRPGVCLGHRRLAIMDPNLGHQPFVNSEGTVSLTYNGEVYNFVEIARELEGITTKSDTEVVLKAYEKWGIDAIQRFRGMFAFAIYDEPKNTVFIVRDRMGIKPLYYYQGVNEFVFASELTALMASGSVPAEIDATSVAEYFRYQYVPTPRSIYKNVFKLEPGHYLKIDLTRKTVDKVKYWELKPTTTFKSQEEWTSQLRSELEETVRIYSRSDVPFGAFLSGGVDSSLVTALMTKILPEPVRTFSIGFSEGKYSELPYAKAASEKCKSIHFERIVSASLAEDILDKVAGHFGEPFADSSAVPTYYVSKETSDQVKMVLSGDGGDEVFGGYDTYVELLKQMRKPFYKFMRPLFWLGSKLIPDRPRVRRYRYSCYIRSLKLGDRYDLYRHIFSDPQLELMLKHKELPPSHGQIAPKSSIDPLTHYMMVDTRTYMLDDILTKVDRMSMANSLEVRIPLLDHKIVELSFSMPWELRFLEGDKVKTKKMLKSVAEDYYDKDFLQRPKMGFGIPVTEWCKGPLKERILSRLGDRSSSVYDWLDYDYTQLMVREFYTKSNVGAATVWSLMMFDIWLNKVHPAHAANFQTS